MNDDGVDPVPDIEERLRTVCGQLNVAHAELVALAAEALATGAWQGHGVKSLLDATGPTTAANWASPATPTSPTA